MDFLDHLSHEPISRLGLLPSMSLSPTDTVLDALRRMQEEKHGCVLVCDGKTPVGVLTERDILRRMGASSPLDVPLGEVVSGNVWSVRRSDSMATALRAMHKRQCRHLVVLDDHGQAAGILSVRQIVREIVDHFPSSVYNLPPDSTKVQTNREGA